MLKFLQKPLYQIIIFVILLGGMVAWYFFKSAKEKELIQGMTTGQGSSEDYKPTHFRRNNKPYLLGSRMPLESTKPREMQQTEQPVAEFEPITHLFLKEPDEANGQQLEVTQTSLRPAKLSLFDCAIEEKELLCHNYAPYGRLIPCETVITIDSSQMDTPIIGLVTEAVYHNKELIIPAGAEVHGKASPNRMRERIDAVGNWVIVWRDGSNFNGAEMVIQGIALDMSKSFIDGKWSISDGSAGLKGYLIKSDSWVEVKQYAAAFLSEFSKGLQETRAVGTILGDVTRAPIASVKNGLLSGSSTVLERFTEQILNEIKEHGYYVRVPAGSQFYLYVTQTLDLKAAQRGNLSLKDIWLKEEKGEHECAK